MFAQMAQQQQAPQGIPPQILQMLMQQGWTPPRPQGQPQMPPQGVMPPQQPSMPPMQGGQQPQQMQGGQPPMQGAPRPPMPPQGQGMPQGSMPPSPQGNPSQGAGGIPPQILQMLMAQMQQQASQQLAAQGRNGDTTIAHLTPGEMTVPPQVQTPKVLATLKHAYKEKGVSPQQFTVGSPASSVNPKTGVPEYNFMSAFLPAAMGLAATAATGGLAAPTLLSAAAGGLGAAGGGLLTGQTPTQAALTGIGSAGGSYIGGNLASGLGPLGGTPGAAGATATNQDIAAGIRAGMNPDQINQYMGQTATQAANGGATASGSEVMSPALIKADAAATPNMLQNALGTTSSMLSTPNIGAGLGSLAGGYIGNQLGAPPKSNAPNYPAGFNNPMPAVGSLGSAQQQLGQTNSVQPMPSFAGYNPATNYPAAYNFGFSR